MSEGRLAAVAAAALVLLAAVGAEAAGGPAADTRPVTIALGGGEQGRWELFGRRTRRGELCVGLENAASSGEGCGRPLVDGNRIGLGTSTGCETGTFVYGFLSRRVARLRVSYGGGTLQWAKIYKSPSRLKFRGRFFLARRSKPRVVTGVRAFDAKGRSLQRIRLEEDFNSPGTGCP